MTREPFLRFSERVIEAAHKGRNAEEIIIDRFGSDFIWASEVAIQVRFGDFKGDKLAKMQAAEGLASFINSAISRAVDARYDRATSLLHLEDITLCMFIWPLRPRLEMLILTRIIAALMRTEHPDEASDLSLHALQRARELGLRQSAEGLSVANMFGHSLKELGKTRRAKIVLRWTESQRRRLEPNSIGLALTLQNIADIVYSEGNMPEAIEILREALEIKESQESPDDLSIANTLSFLATAQHEYGQVEAARLRFERVLQIRSNYLSYDDPDLFAVHLRLSDVYFSLGDYKSANVHNKACTRSISAGTYIYNDKKVALYLRLSLALLDRDEPFVALAKSEQLRAQHSALSGIDAGDRLQMEMSFSDPLSITGNLERAIESLKFALAQPGLSENDILAGESTLAPLLASNGAFSEAHSLAEKILLASPPHGFVELLRRRQAFIAIGIASAGLGEWERCRVSCRDLLREETTEVRASSTSVFRNGTKTQRTTFASFATYLSIVQEHFADDESVLSELATLLDDTIGIELESRQQLHLLTRRIAFSPSEIMSMNAYALSANAQSGDVMSAYIERLEADSRSEIFRRDERSENVGDLNREDGAVLQILCYPPTQITRSDIGFRVVSTGTEVCYSAILSMRAGSACKYLLFPLGTSRDINAAVDADLSAIKKRRFNSDSLSLSALFSEIVPLIAKFPRCVVRPEGLIGLYPVAALWSHSGSRLIDTTACCVELTGSVREPKAAEQQRQPTIVAVGSVTHSLLGMESESSEGVVVFDSLDSTKREIDVICETFPATQRIENFEASMPIVIAALQANPSIFHFAGHGFWIPFGSEYNGRFGDMSALADDFLRCGIALAGCNTWLSGRPTPAHIGTGCLLGADIALLDLHGVGLVVLSSCLSAVGNVEYREGINGLAKAFMMAGAKAVIGSLWEVPDKETAELFETFYRNLRAGVDSVHALRNAQLAMRARQFPASDWAAFVHYGQAYSIA